MAETCPYAFTCVSVVRLPEAGTSLRRDRPIRGVSTHIDHFAYDVL